MKKVLDGFRAYLLLERSLSDNTLKSYNFDVQKLLTYFSEKNIKIRCINKIIEIDGQKMIVSKMLDDEILITGIINNIRIK
jgi:site-specific recombinase XerD